LRSIRAVDDRLRAGHDEIARGELASDLAGDASQPAFEPLRERLRRCHDEICRGVYEHVEARVPAPNHDGSYRRAVQRAIDALVRHAVDTLEVTETIQTVPEALLDEARHTARVGLSLAELMRRYVAVNARLGEYIAEHWEDATVLIAPVSTECLRCVHESVDRLAEDVAREYNLERERLCGVAALSKSELLDRLLCAAPTDRRNASTAVDYHLDDRWHIGLVASGGDHGHTLRVVERELQCEVLSDRHERTLSRAWIGTEQRISPRTLHALLPGGLTAVAIGEPRYGFGGWRQTFHEALAAWPVATAGHERLVHCADVTLEAALLGSEVLTRLHLETYLRPLDGLRVGGQTARETLRAYERSEGNVSATSARLGVDRRTVVNRVRAIETALDQQLSVCSPQISVALRLEEFLDGSREDTANRPVQ
jgi:hypothetical protein